MPTKDNNDPVLKNINLDKWNSTIVGTYNKENSSIEEATVSTILRIERLVPNIKKSTKILIVSNGHTFTPIYLATKFGCKITIMVNKQLTYDSIKTDIKKFNLEELIAIEIREFHMTQFNYDTYEMIWSLMILDNIENLKSTLTEFRRILAPQGRLIMMDLIAEESANNAAAPFYAISEIELQAHKSDLEKVYVKKLVKESKDHIDYIAKSLKNKDITNVKNDILNEKMGWSFLQFQKRNS